MSEIKLRAWDKGNEQMIYPYPTGKVTNATILKNWDDENIMRYLLDDKDGKEVWENDIIKFHIFTVEAGENYGAVEGEKEMTGIVTMGELGVWFESLDKKDEGYILQWYGLHEESFEKIGNIYENADLLK